MLYCNDQLSKFDSENENEIFFNYSLNSSSYRVYNLETLCVEESSDVIFDEVKIAKEVKIDYNDEVVVKTSTPS